MKGSTRRQCSSGTKPMPKLHLQASWNILSYLFSSAMFFKFNHYSWMYSFFLRYLYINILKISIFIQVTRLYLKNLLPHGYIALYFLCITYLTFSIILKIGKKKKDQSLPEEEAGLEFSWFPWTWMGLSKHPLFTNLYLQWGVKLFICCKEKSLWDTKNIIYIKHRNFSFHFVLFVSGSWDNLVLRVQNQSRHIAVLC